MRTPPLTRPTAEYLLGGMDGVHGWLEVSTAVYLASLQALQREAGLAGDVCEIGVHHGKSFLSLTLGLPDGDRALAIDVFGDQTSNLDRSGRGDQVVFERHLDTRGVRDTVDVVAASSLAPEAAAALDGRRFRLFSVDGGHTAEATRNDLELAERSVTAGGLVLLDDVLNPHWLGVVSGLFEYWAAGGSLVPAALVPNKLVLAPSAEGAAACRRLMLEHFAGGREKQDVPFGPGEIDVYGHSTWVVVDVEGEEKLLPGPAPRGPEAEPTVVAPAAYVRDLERRSRRLRRELDAHRDAPLLRELARRHPGVAARVRPVLGPVRTRMRNLRGSRGRP